MFPRVASPFTLASTTLTGQLMRCVSPRKAVRLTAPDLDTITYMLCYQRCFGGIAMIWLRHRRVIYKFTITMEHLPNVEMRLFCAWGGASAFRRIPVRRRFALDAGRLDFVKLRLNENNTQAGNKQINSHMTWVSLCLRPFLLHGTRRLASGI